MSKETTSYEAYSYSVKNSLGVSFSVLGAFTGRIYEDMKPVLEPVIKDKVAQIRINLLKKRR